jgi:gamma-glutamyltranspeptidase
MRSRHLPRRLACLLVLLVPLVGRGSTPAQDQRPVDQAQPTAGAVAAPQPLAADYGAQVLRDGGNAIDAAVATALMLGVVDGHNSGIGGGCFIVIRTAEGELVAIDGRETAPALATRDMFIRNGSADPELSTVGPLAVGTPGMLAACDLALREQGTKTLAELLRGAADVAENGFAIDETYARRLAGEAETIRQFPATAAMLLKADGSPYAAGETLKLPDLAATYRAIADNGIDWFYKGEFASAVDGWMRENGGALRAEDIAGYEAKSREPVVSTYRGYTVAGFPPPSSGGVHVAQILNILENFDLASMDEPTRRHVMAEAMKLAFADRAHWLGDPDFAQVPRGLASQEYADLLGGRIKLDAVTAVESHGTPPEAEQDIFPQLPISAEARTAGEQGGQDATTRPTTAPATGAVTRESTTQAAVGGDPATRPAPRERGVLVGTYDPSQGIEPRTRVIEPRTRVIEPRTRSIEPRTRVIEPRTRVIEPRQRQIIPRSLQPRFPQTRLRYRDSRFDDSHTAHLSAADEHGNFVAITSTVNTGFGSKVVVPGTGVVLNNQMDDFSAQPGVPNFFGLVGAEANAVQQGKRPLSSMSPTIILEGDEPILSIGAAGGPLIISATLQAIVNHLDLGMDLEQALAAPRIHHQWAPDALLVEEGLDPAVRQRLSELGHTVDVERSGGFAVVQAVARNDGAWHAAADPRGGGAGRVVE